MKTVTDQPRLLSVNDAATYCGMSRATLYSEWKKGNLKFVKMFGATRIEFSELNRWIDQTAKQAA